MIHVRNEIIPESGCESIRTRGVIKYRLMVNHRAPRVISLFINAKDLHNILQIDGDHFPYGPDGQQSYLPYECMYD